MDQLHASVSLHGVIVGGGRGYLGVWLDHDPADFGIDGAAELATGESNQPRGSMRTGLTEAWISDEADDNYDLSWFDTIPEDDESAIKALRNLLATDPDPIDRHYQFSELEVRLYKCRDVRADALDDFDATCRLHDAEMDTIREAFTAKWDKVPFLNIYRQMAIRKQKEKDWQASQWWAERGLAVYGDKAAREEDVADLRKRSDRASAELSPSDPAPRTHQQPNSGRSPSVRTTTVPVTPQLEKLTCQRCGTAFQRVRTRGRKPKWCPDCQTSA